MKYENIEDLLPLGKKIIKIEPQDAYELYPEGEEHYNRDGKLIKGHFIQGVQQTRVIKNGRMAGKKFWVFKSPDVIGSNGYPVQINAWDEKQKALFDTGLVEVNVIEGKGWEVNEDGQPLIIDGKGVKKKKAFFNPVSDYERDKFNDEKAIEEVPMILRGNKVENEEITIDDIAGMF